jgi:hypothetical protein
MLGCCTESDTTVTVNAHCDQQHSPLGAKPEFHGYVLVDRSDDSQCTQYSVDVQL